MLIKGRNILFIFCWILNACSSSEKNPSYAVETADELLKNKTVLIEDLKMNSSTEGLLAYYDGEPYSGVAYTFYKNGNQQTKQTYLEGKKEGEWYIWYESGSPLKEGFMKDGKQHGIYREYYTNGNLRSEYEYDMDLKSGVWKGWREDGTQYTIKEFKNDTLEGSLIEFDEKGNQKKEIIYKKGMIVKE
ncbi:MAG: hypothetical protein AAF487_12660 [Bacteroidota bacterium]